MEPSFGVSIVITRLREAGLLWPTLLTLVGLAILVSLGSWQMRRLAWKEALIARVEARGKADPVSLAAAQGAYSASHEEDVRDAVEFTRVGVAGRFLHEQELHVWSPGKSGPAWSVVTPLIVSEGGPAGQRRYPRVVLVIRGAVADAAKSAATRAAGNPAGEQSFIARVRLGHVGAFSNPSSAAKNEWYEYDINAMRRAVAERLVVGSASGTIEDQMAAVAPFFVEAETRTGGEAGPQPQLEKVNLGNRHLEYALTWYGLAATLLAVFLAFARSRWRRVA